MATNGKSKNIKVNEIGLSKKDYRGHATTLCAGCGHNSISNQILPLFERNMLLYTYFYVTRGLAEMYTFFIFHNHN